MQEEGVSYGYWQPLVFPKRILVRLSGEYIDMARAEFCSVSKLVGVNRVEFVDAQDRDPFVHVEGITSLEQCRGICDRALLTMQMLEVYGEGCTHEEMRNSLSMNLIQEQVYNVPGQTLAVTVSAFGASLDVASRRELIHGVLSRFPAKVKVDLKKPKLRLCLWEQRWSPNNTGEGGREGGILSFQSLPLRFPRPKTIICIESFLVVRFVLEIIGYPTCTNYPSAFFSAQPPWMPHWLLSWQTWGLPAQEPSFAIRLWGLGVCRWCALTLRPIVWGWTMTRAVFVATRPTKLFKLVLHSITGVHSIWGCCELTFLKSG